MFIEYVSHLHILQHHKIVTANARVPHKHDPSAELCLRKFAHEEDWRRYVVMFKRKR